VGVFGIGMGRSWKLAKVSSAAGMARFRSGLVLASTALSIARGRYLRSAGPVGAEEGRSESPSGGSLVMWFMLTAPRRPDQPGESVDGVGAGVSGRIVNWSFLVAAPSSTRIRACSLRSGFPCPRLRSASGPCVNPAFREQWLGSLKFGASARSGLCRDPSPADPGAPRPSNLTHHKLKSSQETSKPSAAISDNPISDRSQAFHRGELVAGLSTGQSPTHDTAGTAWKKDSIKHQHPLLAVTWWTCSWGRTPTP